MIRHAKLKDVKQIEALMKSVKGFWDKNWRKDVIVLEIRSSNGMAFVFEKNGKILGFICAHDLGFRGYISEFVVSLDVQKQGIGKALLKRVEEEFQKRGCKTVLADVWKSSEGFYEKMGWSKPDVTLVRRKL